MLITLNQPNATDKAFARYPVAISTSDTPSRTIVMYPVSGNEANTSGTPFESVPNGTQFAVKLQDGQSVDITGLPVGTTYTVVESNNSKANTTGVDYANETNTTTGLQSDTTATVTNKYEVGSLAITKAIKTNYYDEDATPKEKGIIPEAVNANKTYTFKVTLTVPEGVDLTQYITGVASYEGYAHTNGTRVYSFNRTVTGAGHVTISNIPAGTTYSVYETNANTDFLVTDHGSSSPVPSTPGTITANTQSAETITNTYSYGTLKVQKTVAGESNEHATPADVYTFRVELTEPSGVTFDLPTTVQSTTPSNAYSLGGLSSSNGVLSIDYDTGNHKYTIIIQVNKNDNKEITGLPYGTGYTVTEVVRQNGTGPWVSVTDSSLPDPHHPNVNNNEVTGTLNTKEETADITNTYRKVTLTKTDAKDNACLNGASYVLLKLKNNYTSVSGYTEAGFLAALQAATALNFADSTAFASSGVYPYCDGYSTVKTTAGTGADAGMLTIDDSEMSCGLTAGSYLFLELSAPTYYKRNISLSNIFTLSATGDTANTYVDAKSYTNERKTGSLELQKALASGTADDGVTNTVPNQNTEFTYHVVLKAPVGVTLGTETGKYPITISNNIETTAPTPNYGTDATDNRSTCTIDIKVKKNIASNALPTISGIPYGTEYTVTEPAVNLPATGNTALNWVQTGKTNDTGTFSDTTTDTVTKKATFENGLTGELEITKHVAPSINGATVTDKTCTFEVTFLPNDANTTSTLSKYTLKDGSGNTLTPTNNKLTVTISNVSTTSNDKTFTIKGIPLGMQYQVQETNSNSADGTPPTKYELNSGSEVTGATATAETVSASAPAQKVKFTNTYVVTANTGSLKLIKTLKGDYGSYHKYNTVYL